MSDKLLLHGALGSSIQLTPFPISEECFRFDFLSHGDSEYKPNLTISDLVEQTKGFIDRNHLKNTNVFGYSMGGYVALAVELKYPGTFKTIVTLGTKLEWNQDIVKKEVAQLDPERIEQKVPQFAQLLQKYHKTNWKDTLKSIAHLMKDLGEHPIITQQTVQLIQCPVTLFLGTKDHMVSIQETEAVAKALPNGNYISLEGIKHAIETIDMGIKKQLALEVDKSIPT